MLQAGEVIDRYVIEAPLGEGGMGVVYRARHRTLGGEYAIKVLRARSQDVLAMTLAEGRLQSRIRHPNVAMVTDIIETPAGPALVMEYVDGPDLRSWLRLDDPPLKQRLAVFDGVLQGVGAAHAHGLVHRDIKPANILLAGGRATPFPKVTDFGLAQTVLGQAAGQDNWNMVGTPGYMAPEQARNPDLVDHRADIFSLGCVLYRLACGRRPFEADSVTGLIRASMQGRYTSASMLSPDLSPKVVAAIDGCLQPDPERRVPSCAVLREILETGHPWSPVQRQVSGDDTWWDGSFSQQRLDEVVDLEARRAEREAELRRILGAQVRSRPEAIADREAWREGMIPKVWRRAPEATPAPKPDGRRKVAVALIAGGAALAGIAALLWLGQPAPLPEVPMEEPVAGPAAEPVAPQVPTEAPPPRPSAAQVSVKVIGGEGAKVCIQGSKCYTGGAVPAGTYPIWVMDPKEGAYEAGSVTLEAGERVSLTCDLEAKACGR